MEAKDRNKKIPGNDRLLPRAMSQVPCLHQLLADAARVNPGIFIYFLIEIFLWLVCYHWKPFSKPAGAGFLTAHASGQVISFITQHTQDGQGLGSGLPGVAVYHDWLVLGKLCQLLLHSLAERNIYGSGNVAFLKILCLADRQDGIILALRLYQLA